MSQIGEIITLQVGNYANFVGAHYFNLQDPAQHPEYVTNFSWKPLWREGENVQRQRVLTPRVLMFDVKDNWTDRFVQSAGDHLDLTSKIASASGAGNVLDKVQEGISWDGTVQKVVLPSNDTSDSDEGPYMASSTNKSTKKVRVDEKRDYKHWGEYAKWRLHSTEKFAFRIPNFMYNAESNGLISYGQGLDAYHKLEDNVVDGIRLYAEDCDYLEGFHTLVDEFDGFSGVAGGILEHLGDEYDKKANFGIGLNKQFPEGANEQTLKDYKIRISNTAQLWSSFNRYARVYTSFGICQDIFSLHPVPRQFPNFINNPNSAYMSSSILAAALDTLTAPYRQLRPSFPLHEMTSLLNAFGHKMTMIGSSLPFSMNQQTLFGTLSENGLASISSLMPNVDLDLEKSVGNIFVVRGVDSERVISKTESKEYKHADIRSLNDCLELYCHESFSKSVHVVKNIPTSFKYAHSFPRLFAEDYLKAHANEKVIDATQGEAWLLPAITSAHNSPSVGKILEKIVSVTGGGANGSVTKMKAFYEPSSATCNSSIVEFEDYAESVSELESLAETYTT